MTDVRYQIPGSLSEPFGSIADVVSLSAVMLAGERDEGSVKLSKSITTLNESEGHSLP